MFEDLEVANKEYEDLKIKYDELLVAKNGADEKIKTYEEGNKNYENALKHYKQLSMMNPNKENYKYNVVTCYEALGEYQVAIKILEEIAELEVEEYKLKKIIYRLNVCLTILNSETE